MSRIASVFFRTLWLCFCPHTAIHQATHRCSPPMGSR
jgi:hypothetical protein